MGIRDRVNALPGQVARFAFQGSTVVYRIRIGAELELDAVQLRSAGPPFGLDDPVTVSLPPSAIRVLPAEVPAGSAAGSAAGFAGTAAEASAEVPA
ncbi:TOBE domain-containing protein [Nonomuraea zeae]|uniref:TOBE domain-containing protein n=1 Tax=Nonomuraea zeae TaxID=1642303 RepID=A0A5S4FMB9_9ACTN|nr:TOBE domain-containing protein [Nonomuraea zeae]TMR10300.1 TOBE domain-containing protein [Nonomuraea zeae]